MKKHRIGNIVLVASAICGLSAGSVTGQPEEHVQRFGIEEGAILQDGYVFVDGEYIDPPYRVARKGLALYVNGKLVQPAREWPPYDFRVSEEPRLPANIDEESSFDDLVDSLNPFDGYLSKKSRYIRQHFPDRVVEMKAETYRSLPFVRSVDVEGSTLIVTTKRGEVRRIGAHPLSPGSPLLSAPPSEDAVLGEVESRRRALEDLLKIKCALFLFRNGQKQVWTPAKTAEDLPYLMSLLESARSPEDKMHELKSLELLDAYTCPRWNAFVANFSKGVGLDSRLAKLDVDLAKWKEQRLRRIGERQQQASQGQNMKIDNSHSPGAEGQDQSR